MRSKPPPAPTVIPNFSPRSIPSHNRRRFSMDSPFSTLGFVIFAISTSFFAFLAQSQVPDWNKADDSFELILTAPPPPLLPLPPPPPADAPPPHHSQNHKPANLRPPPPPHYRRHRHRHVHSPPPPPHRMNAGKKVGLLFVGIAAIMQVFMVGFLVHKRRQLLKSNDRYENCS